MRPARAGACRHRREHRLDVHGEAVGRHLLDDPLQPDDALVAQPSIRNVYVGDQPTWWLEPGIPHDGYLGEFLMQSKGVIRD